MQLSDNEGKTPLDYAQELENGEDMLAILEGEVNNSMLCIGHVMVYLSTLYVQVMHHLSGHNSEV